jgi:hypothetical protein
MRLKFHSIARGFRISCVLMLAFTLSVGAALSCCTETRCHAAPAAPQHVAYCHGMQEKQADPAATAKAALPCAPQLVASLPQTSQSEFAASATVSLVSADYTHSSETDASRTPVHNTSPPGLHSPLPTPLRI